MKLNILLYAIAIVMAIAWLAGMLTSHTLHGYIHLSLVVAASALIARVFRDDDTWA